MNGWQILRQWLPFLAGVFGGGAMFVGIWIAWEAAVAGFSDWQYAIMLVLCAACFLAGGALVLTSVLEIS